MVEIKGSRLFIPPHFIFFLIIVITFCISLAAQEADRDKDKDAEKKAAAASGIVQISGSVRCSKPDPSYSIEVPDRPGHSLIIARRSCTWTEPLEILGGKTKTGISVAFLEHMEGRLHPHGYEIDTLDNGEKITMRSLGQVPGDKGPVDLRGQWSFMRGTGKYKGIRGGGTYEGKLDADDVLTLKLEGTYDPVSMTGGKKK